MTDKTEVNKRQLTVGQVGEVVTGLLYLVISTCSSSEV